MISCVFKQRSVFSTARSGLAGGIALCLVNFSLARADETANPPASAAVGTNAAPVAPAATTNVAALQQNAPASDLPTAILLYRQGKQDEALATLNLVLQKEPQNITALILRGAIYTVKQQWDPAAKDYQAVLKIDNTNTEAKFDLADLLFRQHQFDDARVAFVALPDSKDDDVRDLTSYKIFLCDLLGGHDDVAAKELEVFNKVADRPSYYFANASWSLFHKKPEEARTWLLSAGNIYPTRKHLLYMSIMKDMGYLPLPPMPAAQ